MWFKQFPFFSAISAPTFMAATRLLRPRTYSADINLGEMFLNFPLPLLVQLLSGVDVTAFAKELFGADAAKFGNNKKAGSFSG